MTESKLKSQLTKAYFPSRYDFSRPVTYLNVEYRFAIIQLIWEIVCVSNSLTGLKTPRGIINTHSVIRVSCDCAMWVVSFLVFVLGGIIHFRTHHASPGVGGGACFAQLRACVILCRLK